MSNARSYGEGSVTRVRTTTLKDKCVDFRQIVRSRTIDEPFASRAVLDKLVFAFTVPASWPFPATTR